MLAPPFRTRHGSGILHDLCSENFQCYIQDMAVYNSRSLSDVDTNVTVYNICNHFRQIYDHIRSCEYFNGLIMAVDYRARQRKSKEDYMSLRCSCGFDMYLPISALDFQYRNMYFEDIIMSINQEYSKSTRGNIEDKVLRMDATQKAVRNLELKDKLKAKMAEVKSPLYGMEV